MYGSSMVFEALLRAELEKTELLCSEDGLRLSNEVARLEAEEAKMQLVMFVAGVRLSKGTINQMEYDIIASEYDESRQQLLDKQLELSCLTRDVDHKITCLNTSMMMLVSALESIPITVGYLVDSEGCATETMFLPDFINPFIGNDIVL